MYETSGTVKVIYDTQTFASGFAKREFVITTNADKFPQDLKFEVVKDKCALLDQFREGMPVTVNFDVRGNEYNGKYYVNLAAWKVTSNGQAPAQQQPAQRRQSTSRPMPEDKDGDFDDVPF